MKRSGKGEKVKFTLLPAMNTQTSVLGGNW
jgi:hypothetical protein